MFGLIRKMFIGLLTELVKLDSCVESCNTLNDLSDKLCVPNKTKYLNIHVFNMITGKNGKKNLTKDIS